MLHHLFTITTLLILKKQCPVKSRGSSLSLLTINRVNNEGSTDWIRKAIVNPDRESPSHWLLVAALLLVASWVHAQVVHIPDPNLRDAIREALQLNTPVVTEADMLRLRQLGAQHRGIVELTGLEYAINLEHLHLSGNPLSSLDLLAGLLKLESLSLHETGTTDISVLASLTRLHHLGLSYNWIENIEPLANLPKLEYLDLGHNRIRDVSSLANLHNLEHLTLEYNQIADYSPLDGLALSHFTYDQSCELPPEPIEPRLESRSLPSPALIFSSKVINKPDLVNTITHPNLSDWGRYVLATTTPFDIYAIGQIFGPLFQKLNGEWQIRMNMEAAIEQRDLYWSINPNMIFLREIRMWDAGAGHFPDDSPYWARDNNGNRIFDPDGERSLDSRLYLINWSHPDVQDEIVEKAIAVSKCGLYDGILIDRWREDIYTLRQYVTHEEEVAIRADILRRIRAEARPDFLIIVNSNGEPIPHTAQYVNGCFMETKLPLRVTGELLERGIAYNRDTLEWHQKNLREPKLTALIQGHAIPTEPPDSPDNRRWMRVFTTMSLTHSDGYVSYIYVAGTDADTYWYDFWDADLGQPVSPLLQFYEDIEKLYIREFTNGWAVYNQSGEAQVITLPDEGQSVASGLANTKHAILNFDGDLFLRTASKEPADVNGDGMINILDLVLVAQGFGADDSTADVNGDGVVNVFDLVFVANQFN